jgi:hypothetical protein
VTSVQPKRKAISTSQSNDLPWTLIYKILGNCKVTLQFLLSEEKSDYKISVLELQSQLIYRCGHFVNINTITN